MISNGFTKLGKDRNSTMARSAEMQDRTRMKNGQQDESQTPSSSVGQSLQERRRSLTIGLLRAREAVMSHFRPILAAHDVTEQQWRVIRVLFEAGTLDASEVADKASILAPSLTRMIRSLEER